MIGEDETNYVGDNGANTLTGGGGADLIQGLGGNDQLRGEGGDDTIEGGDGADIMTDGAGSDRLRGGAGDDYVFAGAGENDSYHGGGGVDGIDYSNSAAAVRINLSITDAQDTGGGGIDTLAALENLSGSTYDDTLTGTAGANIITGEIGNDFIDGGEGDDVLNQAQMGFGPGNDTVFGGLGDDIMFSGAGSDVLIGGDGHDAVYFWSSFTGFPPPTDPGRTVTLQSGGPQFISSGVQVTLDSIEELQGGSGGDDFTGAFKDQTLRGMGGDDELHGGSATDLLDGGSDDDLLEGGSGIDTLIGGVGNDTLLGEYHDDTLVGGTGNDSMDGGAGFDFASFADAANTIFLTLASTAAQQTQEGSDTFLNIEGVIGSRFNDAFSGGTGGEMLIGLGGNDSLAGGAGADTLQGTNGKDLLIGGAGKDVLTGGSGIDTFKYLTASNSTAADPDRISDLETGDVIDLAGIDANTALRGNQAFVLRAEHTGPGQAVLSYNAATDRTSLSLYVNSGDTVDALIVMNGDHTGHLNFVL